MRKDLRQKTVSYMKRRGLAKAEMARLIGQDTALFSKYLDRLRIPPSGTEWVEAWEKKQHNNRR